MIAKIIAALSAFIISVIASSGYLGIVLLMAIESACIPLPSEVIMPFSGALTVPAIASQYGRTAFHLLWVATAGAIGCNLGSLLAYELGAWGGRHWSSAMARTSCSARRSWMSRTASSRGTEARRC